MGKRTVNWMPGQLSLKWIGQLGLRYIYAACTVLLIPLCKALESIIPGEIVKCHVNHFKLISICEI